MNNESDMKRGVSSVKRHYNPSILKETDPLEGMDEIALRELVTTLRTRLAEVEADAAVMREALDRVIVIAKVVKQNRDSDWHDQISNLKFYEPR